MSTKYRLVRGEGLRKRDVVDWSPSKILSFIQFADFFISKETDPHTFDVVMVKIEAAKERAKDEQFWDEFLTRIEQKDQTVVQFRNKLMSMVRVVLSWLKTSPYAITDQMRAIMEPNQRLNWCLDSFKVVPTKIGGEVMVLNQDENTDPRLPNHTPDASNIKSPDVQYAQALINVTSILKDLTTGIKQADIKALGTADRIKLINSMLPNVARAIGGHRPNIKVFKQLVINQAGRDDLEKAFLDYAEGQQSDE